MVPAHPLRKPSDPLAGSRPASYSRASEDTNSHGPDSHSAMIARTASLSTWFRSCVLSSSGRWILHMSRSISMRNLPRLPVRSNDEPDDEGLADGQTDPRERCGDNDFGPVPSLAPGPSLTLGPEEVGQDPEPDVGIGPGRGQQPPVGRERHAREPIARAAHPGSSAPVTTARRRGPAGVPAGPDRRAGRAGARPAETGPAFGDRSRREETRTGTRCHPASRPAPRSQPDLGPEDLGRVPEPDVDSGSALLAVC